MSLDDLIGLMILGTYGTMMLLEALFPARQYPTKRLWRLKGWAFLVGMAVVATLTPLALPAEFLAEHRLIDGTGLGIAGGTVVGYGVFSLVAYALHRAAHRFDFMWRTFHQMHHAPQRLDMGGAALFHPFEIVAYVALSTVTTTFVLGLRPEAAALTGFVAQFYSFFQHMNVKTPRLLGYLIQRPEAHFVHHGRDVHAYNYGDFPLWDMLFGTFRNPADFGSTDVGFPSPQDRRLGAMLALRDVSDAVGTRTQRSAAPSAATTVPSI
jgi:sterol desaturase/sphingolipid hydroxylase (fatty acid hydroxylase superfamily)